MAEEAAVMWAAWPAAKVLHVVLAASFIAGLLSGVALLARWGSLAARPSSRGSPGLHRATVWWRRVTGLLLLGVWMLGLWLAIQGHWMGATWLNIKIVAVLLLSAVHGGLSGLLRHALAGRRIEPDIGVFFAVPAILLLAGLIVVLAITQPG